MTESVKIGLDLVIKCMEGSMDLAEFKDEAPLWGLDQSLHIFSPGMMTHIFFEIELAKLKVLKHIDLNIESNTELQGILKTINSVTLNLARISNDMVTLNRELMSGGFTNTLIHLCQDEINKNKNDNTNLSWLLQTCCKSPDPKARDCAKNKIIECMKRYNINELMHTKWTEQLRCLESCKESCRQVLPGEQGLELSHAIDRLCKGNENLLVMYMIMRKFEGAT